MDSEPKALPTSYSGPRLDLKAANQQASNVKRNRGPELWGIVPGGRVAVILVLVASLVKKTGVRGRVMTARLCVETNKF